MICSYCYKTGITSKHDVSAWWNNPEDSVHVCSDECKDKPSGLLKDGKWMTHRPERMFRKKDPDYVSPNFGAVTVAK